MTCGFFCRNWIPFRIELKEQLRRPQRVQNQSGRKFNVLAGQNFWLRSNVWRIILFFDSVQLWLFKKLCNDKLSLNFLSWFVEIKNLETNQCWQQSGIYFTELTSFAVIFSWSLGLLNLKASLTRESESWIMNLTFEKLFHKFIMMKIFLKISISV